MEEIKEEIAKIVSSSGDCHGATREELRKIDKLVRLFKLYYYLKAQGAEVGDAIKTGADYEIIGRAIYGASDPKKAAEELYKEILEA